MSSGKPNYGYGRQESQVQLTRAEAGVTSSVSDMGSVGSDPFPERLNSMEKPQYDEVFVKTVRDKSSCGWGSFRPQCFQHFNRPWIFMIFLCLFAMTQSATISGLVLVSITTLERRFSLPSTRTGTISSFFEFVVTAVIVFVTYAGEKGNKPVFIGVGAAIFGVGSFVFTLPHFLTGPYQYGTDIGENLCGVNRTDEYDSCGVGSDGTAPLSQYFWVFIAAQTLHGLGAAPLYTLGQTFLYENIKPKLSSVYIGIFQAAATFSPAIGFLGGGVLLDSLYTDLTVPRDQLGIDHTSPLWVGNWWIGFLLVGVVTLLTSIPLTAYPKYLPGARAFKHQRKPSTQKGAEFVPSAGFGGSLRDFPRAMFTLLKNMPYLFINLGVACESFIIACVSVFGPKFVESQFNETSGGAAVLVGVVIIPAGLFGCLFGGWIIKKFRLEFKGQIKFCIVVLFTSFLMTFVFMLTCDNVPFAGITRSYVDNGLIQAPESLNADCNSDCTCADDFDPVCGSNNILYNSACHAGCTDLEVDVTETRYMDCQCIIANITDDQQLIYGTATKGRCENITCVFKPVFFVLVAMVLALSFSIIVPSITAVLQVVAPSQRSTAMGLQSLLYRGLGTVPGPIVFGALIDRSCILWERECGSSGQGTCWMYRNTEFALYTFGIVVICRVLSMLFFCGSLLTYKPIEEPSK